MYTKHGGWFASAAGHGTARTSLVNGGAPMVAAPHTEGHTRAAAGAVSAPAAASGGPVPA